MSDDLSGDMLAPSWPNLVLIGNDETRNSLKSSLPISLLGNTMEATESLKNLCVAMDADNSMQRHVANLCFVCNFRLRKL